MYPDFAFSKPVAKTANGILGRLVGVFAKTQREDEVALRLGKIDLAREGHIPVLSPS